MLFRAAVIRGGMNNLPVLSAPSMLSLQWLASLLDSFTVSAQAPVPEKRPVKPAAKYKQACQRKCDGGAVQIVWPRTDDVQHSNIGLRSGIGFFVAASAIFEPAGTASGQPRTVKQLFRDKLCKWQGSEGLGRHAAMPHMKSYCRVLARAEDSQSGSASSDSAAAAAVAWFILGSHNLSGAAWGSLEKDETQLYVRYGVLAQNRCLVPAVASSSTSCASLPLRV